MLLTSRPHSTPLALCGGRVQSIVTTLARKENAMSERITNQQLDRVTAWLQERTNATCPFCGERRWTIDDELTSVPTYQSGAPHLQLDRGHTLLMVTCDQCGFTASFAAKKIVAQ
jgi:predicted nucleic-acid-binding Zn-ribbon protein